MSKKFKQDKGVAGLTILLSLVVMLFVIGLLVMIFSIMGSKMSDASYTETTVTVGLEDVGLLADNTGYLLDTRSARNFRGAIITTLYNNTNEALGVGNVTLTGYTLNAVSNTTGLADVFINYTYIYDADTTATDVMNATTTGVANVTSWFEIFIVIGAMVVLILLTVIIITAINSSGMVAGAGSTRDDVGSA